MDECMTNFAIMVTQSSEYLEVRSQGCTKARVVNILLNRLSFGLSHGEPQENIQRLGLPSFVFCVGAEQMNPSIFEAIEAVYRDVLEKTSRDGSTTDMPTSIEHASQASNSTAKESATLPVDSINGYFDRASAQKGMHITATTEVETTQLKPKSRKELHGGNQMLSSLGVFTCFYGGQKKRELSNAEFFVDSEADLRKILRGLVKLSALGKV